MPTKVRIGLHGDRLYVAFECAEDRLNAIQAHVRERDGKVWEDDCVELFLDPGCTGKRYWQVSVNSVGTVARLGPDGARWDAEVAAAARVEPERKRWVVELAVPLGELKLAPAAGGA
ncbi:MAG: carbohydrate-binding family 9-like protein [Armatimonadetes bacterium]|nr:carbohydrate-binding family 9-like protein [Armatimonadota bacterium]